MMNRLALDLVGSRWLDLCSGSGIMACEALQRGAETVVAIERDRRIAAVCRSNLQAVQQGLPPQRRHLSRMAVHCMPAERWLATATEAPFDLIYADPPYDAGLYGTLAAGVRSSGLLRTDGILLLECGSGRVPSIPTGWEALEERRYGSTTVLLLQLEQAPEPEPDEDGAAYGSNGTPPEAPATHSQPAGT